MGQKLVNKSFQNQGIYEMHQSDNFHKRSGSVNNRKYRNVDNIAGTDFEVEKLYNPVDRQKFTYNTRKDTNSTRLYYDAIRSDLGNDDNKMFARPRNSCQLYKSIGKRVDDNRKLYPAPPTKVRNHLYFDGVDKSPDRYKTFKNARAKSVEPFSDNVTYDKNPVHENYIQNDENLQDINVQGNSKLQKFKPIESHENIFAENNRQQNDEPIEYGDF